jgi:hypothetical protein
MRGLRLKWFRLPVVVGLLGLATVGPASADTGTDQITGAGATPSVLTVTWQNGLLNSDNQTSTPRDPKSPLSFMYPDFQHLQVTVSQTHNLVHQAVNVTWTGFPPTPSGNGGFLQMMQCYGDATTGPSPEDCEYGSTGLFGGSFNGITTREGSLCAPGAVASATKPPGLAGGSGAVLGCDSLEPTSPTHVQPGTEGPPTTYSVPFVPVNDPTHPIYGAAVTYYSSANTNEIQDIAANNDGKGQQFFRMLTGTEAPGLGCGEVESSTGQPRDCWLVIVPRGNFKSNGFQLRGSVGQPAFQTDSPLGASAWAQRIQIHLGFNQIQTPCPIGSAKELQTVGTQLVQTAVGSWQLALNQAANCQTLYSYIATPEATDTSQLEQQTGAAGLAFTTIPIGSEQARDGTLPNATVPPLLYAPVAVTATTFAFNVSLPGTGGFDGQPIKLTPRLAAKALTQSYKADLPDINPEQTGSGPAWVQRNPLNITQDPEFQQLNPNLTESQGTPAAPLLTEDHSEVNDEVWQWVDSDPATRQWLTGTPDQFGMGVDPDYHNSTLNLAAPIDSFPRAYSACGDFGLSNDTPQKEEIKCSLDQLPYVENFAKGASAVASANTPEGAGWDPQALDPAGNPGFWGKGAQEIADGTFMWALTDSPDLASFGLVPAELCAPNGNNCVEPNTASVAAALANAKPDSTGLLHVDPSAPGAGAYPLVDVTYAAVRTDLDPATKAAYAKLIQFAAGQGQTPGVDPGQLPHGYLPMTAAMQQQAQCVITQLNGGQCAPGTPPPPSSGNTGNANGVSGSTAPGSTGPAPNANPTGAAAAASNTSPTTTKSTPGGPSTSQAPPGLAARVTPNPPVGAIRWVLLAVVIAGVIGAGGGLLLRADNTVLTKLLGRLRR